MRPLAAVLFALLALAPSCKAEEVDPLEGLRDNGCGMTARCLVEDCLPLRDGLGDDEADACSGLNDPGCTAAALDWRMCEVECKVDPSEACAPSDNGCIDKAQHLNRKADEVYDSCETGACDVTLCRGVQEPMPSV